MEKSLTLDWGTDELHEECGVFGMYDLDGNDVASTIYYGLFALQHRGLNPCGSRAPMSFLGLLITRE